VRARRARRARIGDYLRAGLYLVCYTVSYSLISGMQVISNGTPAGAALTFEKL
jgi:hypothetical protein